MSTARPDPDQRAASVPRVVLASFIGTTIEWYDFFLYGTASALVFNKLFFPTLEPIAGTIAAFATYSIGFFARPVGGVVFGHFGDRIGRKSMLVTTLMLMGTSTFLIGLLPTYSQIGVAAPVLLVVLRFIQGFGVGGEWGGAVLMVVEHGHQGKRGFYASWVQAGVPAGSLLAAASFRFVSLASEQTLLQWGWRIPFLLGIVLLGIGLFIRLQVLESPLFEEARDRPAPKSPPFFEVLRRQPSNVLLAMGARMAENAAFYIFTVAVITYANVRHFVTETIILNCVLIASAVQFFLIPAYGVLSDYVGRRPVYLGGAIGLALYAFPFFWIFDTGEPMLIGLAIALALAVHAAMYAPMASFFAELFGTDVRYTGASIGYQLASPFSGGLAPMITTALLKWSGGQPWPVAIYMIFLSAISVVSVWLAQETHRVELRSQGVANNPTDLLE